MARCIEAGVGHTAPVFVTGVGSAEQVVGAGVAFDGVVLEVGTKAVVEVDAAAEIVYEVPVVALVVGVAAAFIVIAC